MRHLSPVRAGLVEVWTCWLIERHAFARGGGRVVAPAGDLLSFASPKESKQRKGDPKSATPALRFGVNLRRGGCGVRRETHCALKRSVRTAAASQMTKHGRFDAHATPQPPRRRRSHRGWTAENSHTGHRCARPGLHSARRMRPRDGAERSDGPKGCWLFGCPISSVCAEERSGQRIRDRDCLSAASLSETPLDASTAGCPKRSAGTQTVGSPSFAFFSWRRKKRRCPAGGTSRQTASAKAYSQIKP